MKARYFKQPRTHEPVMNQFVGEALARQAEIRPPKAQPKELPRIQSLPRVRKGPRKRPPA